MTQTPEQMALQQSLALCQGHAAALQEALQNIHARDMDLDVVPASNSKLNS